VTVINYVDGQHAFDLLDDMDESREIIKQTLGSRVLMRGIAGSSSHFLLLLLRDCRRNVFCYTSGTLHR
jgi:hypothetical protein